MSTKTKTTHYVTCDKCKFEVERDDDTLSEVGWRVVLVFDPVHRSDLIEFKADDELDLCDKCVAALLGGG